MDALMMTLGSGGVSGLRPYFMVFVLGIAERFFDIAAIPDVFARTDVLVITAILLVVDFAADKVPFLDSFWDQLNTVVRPIAGGAIGYLVGGETDTTTAIVMAALGGGVAFGVHAAKTTARAAVNLSPEPVSNAVVSSIEDVVALSLGLMVVAVPAIAGLLALLLLAAGIYLAIRLRRMYRNVRDRARAMRARRAGIGPDEAPPLR
ncbi:MAG: DUF4126 domain-containing protein [Brachybacterium sp.]|nr:DUF4126 domain-containing protein [Brachybacterium sp.]